MIKYIVEASLWFDKLNGNTYHAVNITSIETNKLIFSSGFTYGYGEQYRHTAIDGLIKLGLFKEADRFNHDLISEMIFFTVNENALKRDLTEKEVC